MGARHFDEQKLIEISDKIDLVELVAESVQLHRKGNRYWGLCPFHQEKTPSFSVNREKNVFYCFGCHKGGNVFAYLMQKEGMSFREAALLLAQKAGVELELSPRDEKRQDQRREILAMNKLAAAYYHQQLMNSQGEPAREYLLKRGLKPQSLETFQLGYAGSRGDQLIRLLQKQGCSLETMKSAGLARHYEQSQRYYDLFRERVIFPIARYDGGIIAFGGRTMGDAVPKYLNSPESDVFSKRRNLYGLLQAREHMRRLNQCVLVEGYMDCIKLHQAGINNAVASLGTAFTQEQADLIARYAESVIVIYDGDEAGQRETLRALDVLEKQGLSCYVLVLPLGKDPDDLVSSLNPSEVWQYIDRNRIAGIEYRIKRLVENAEGDGIEDQLKIIREIKPRIQGMESALEREHYCRLLAQRLRMEEQAVLKEISGRRRELRREAGRPRAADYQPVLAERLVAALMQKPAWYERFVQALGPGILEGTAYGKILEMWARCRDRDLDEAESKAAMEEELFLMGLAGDYARIMVLNEEHALKESELDELISRLRKRREDKGWNVLLKRVEKLGESGSFEDYLRMILDFQKVLNYSREGEAY